MVTVPFSQRSQYNGQRKDKASGLFSKLSECSKFNSVLCHSVT